MKKTVLMTVAILATQALFAQSDSDTTTKKPDTLRVGKFVIIKKNQPNKKSFSINIGNDNVVNYSKTRKRRNVSTNWLIFDLGFANMRDKTDYSFAQAGPYLKQLRPQDAPVDKNSFRLKQGKTSNVNIWFFMQKLNVYKHVVNLKYGLGYEMYNFRYENSISFRTSPSGPYVYNDSILFSKNKLYAAYLTVPFMININATPGKRNGFSFSAGVSAGYKTFTRNKQISDERGKVKYKGDLDLQPWRLAAIGEIGLGPVRLYGTYSFNNLYNSETRLTQYPYAVGIRFSNW